MLNVTGTVLNNKEKNPCPQVAHSVVREGDMQIDNYIQCLECSTRKSTRYFNEMRHQTPPGKDDSRDELPIGSDAETCLIA